MKPKVLVRSLIAAGVISAFGAGAFSAGHWSPQEAAAANAPVAVAAGPAASAPLPDFTGIVERNGPAVVNISVRHDVKADSGTRQFSGVDPSNPLFEFFRQFPGAVPHGAVPERGMGSGFIVSSDGVILTNAHVVDDATEVTVKLTDRREFRAKVIGSDKPSDVAVLKIEATGLPTVQLGSSMYEKVGEWVLAIGSPYGFENSVTSGIISAKSRSLPDGTYIPFIQTDVAVNPGNSGGPLFNMNGQVIGINAQIFTHTGGYQMLENGDCIIVALSGGADSCALLLSLIGLAESRCLKLVVAHFNHGLRHQESDEDEVFCRNLAQKFALTFVTEKMRHLAIPKGISPEEYFRHERYRFLDKAAADHGANKIALGHHLHDQAETVLLNILRGSGLDGLKGFLPMRGNKYIRPLMEVSRQEIYAFLGAAALEYREDSSNSSKIYLRNSIRGELIPFLKNKYNPQIEQNLVRMAEIIRRDEEFISEYVCAIMTSPHIQKKEDQLSFSAEYFKTLHTSLRYRLIKALLESMATDGRGFSSSHIESLVDLVIKSSSGKEISLPHGLHAQKEYDNIIINYSKIEEKRDYEYVMTIPGTIDLKERDVILSAKRGRADEIDFDCIDHIYFDADKIKEPLIIRNRKNGDWFSPLGTPGSQKIKKLFIDRKIPRPERDRIALITDRESVIWIENLHLSDRVKVSPETKKVVVLEIRSLPRELESK